MILTTEREPHIKFTFKTFPAVTSLLFFFFFKFRVRWLIYLAILSRICGTLETASIIDGVHGLAVKKARAAKGIRPSDSSCEHLSKDTVFVSSAWKGMLAPHRSLQLIITIFRAIFGEKELTAI